MNINKQKKAVVVHSGGMDSSICLKLAANEFGKDFVLSLSFSFGQRHSNEIESARTICEKWDIDHMVIPLDFYTSITNNALINHHMAIEHNDNSAANTLVVGRNGLFARIGAIVCDSIGAQYLFLGVVGLEEENSGYRDCSREYMDLMEQVLRIDLDNNNFSIRTPLVDQTKLASLELAHSLGILSFLLERTLTCYNGIKKQGCRECPSCKLRNQAIIAFKRKYPEIPLPYNL